MPNRKTPKPPAVCYVDAQGGALAALAAGVARAKGRGDVVAATTSATIAVPAEVRTVLEEIGASLPDVGPATSMSTAEIVELGQEGTEPLLVLYQGEGDLERLALARIARDRIERRLELRLSLTMGETPKPPTPPVGRPLG
jgi:hypothetical protein